MGSSLTFRLLLYSPLSPSPISSSSLPSFFNSVRFLPFPFSSVIRFFPSRYLLFLFSFQLCRLNFLFSVFPFSIPFLSFLLPSLCSFSFFFLFFTVSPSLSLPYPLFTFSFLLTFSLLSSPLLSFHPFPSLSFSTRSLSSFPLLLPPLFLPSLPSLPSSSLHFPLLRFATSPSICTQYNTHLKSFSYFLGLEGECPGRGQETLICGRWKISIEGGEKRKKGKKKIHSGEELVAGQTMSTKSPCLRNFNQTSSADFDRTIAFPHSFQILVLQ